MSTISFARGAPSPDIVDAAGLSAAAVRAFRADPAGITSYGDAYGYLPLRTWIAAKHRVDVDKVLVTNGSLQADAFLFAHLVSPGDEVVVERPTYDRTLRSLRGMGATVHAVSLRPDGLDVDELRKMLESGIRPRLAHIIPNYQNPAGVTLPLDRREALLGLAREFDFTVFEDDPYVDIRFRGPALPSLLTLDAGTGRVVHASSFTKTVCPGVRVGYLIGDVELIAAIARRATDTYISPGLVAQGIVHQFCVSGDIDRSIQRVRAALSERARILADELRTHIPDVRFTEPDGGYFLWVEFPEDVDVADLAVEAERREVTVVKGTDFVLEGGQHALRLAYAGVTGAEIAEGVRRLASAVESVRSGRLSDI